MSLAIALLSRRSLAFELYTAQLNGESVADLAAAYRLPIHQVEEQLSATRLALAHQVLLTVDRESKVFGPTRPAANHLR